MPRDRNALALEGLIDQLRKVVLGVGDAMVAHTDIIAI
jgi:hypothetical protein